MKQEKREDKERGKRKIKRQKKIGKRKQKLYQKTLTSVAEVRVVAGHHTTTPLV